MSGIGTYTYNVATRLGQHPDVSSLAFFSRNGWAVRDTLQGTDKGGVPLPLRRVFPKLPYAYEFRDRLSGYLLRRTKMAHREYLYHEPNYLPVPYDGPCVVTISDLSHLRYPALHPMKRVKRLESNLARSMETARELICHSEFTRDELVNFLGVSPKKIHVVYHGVDPAFRPHTESESHPVLRRYGLEAQGYLLSVGTMEPRKNLLGLIDAFLQLPASLRRTYPLVIAGPKGWLTQRTEKAMEALISGGSLRWLGYIPLEDLPALYAAARGFAYVSLYEGFGLPIVEAMASGVPLLTSDRAAMPEIAGSAALLVNPEDTDEIAAGLRRILLDDAFRKEAIAGGLKRAERFTWENTVDETVKVYQSALAGHSD